MERLEDRLALSFFPAVAYDLSNWTYFVRTGDFTSDGIPDLLVPALRALSVLPGNGNGTFGVRIDTPLTDSVDGVTIGDFDFDGVLDAALAHLGGAITIHRGQGNGRFVETAQYNGGNRPAALVADDINLDGVLDLVATDWSQGTDQGYVNTLFGYGNGTFTDRVAYPVGRGAQHLTTGDVNWDGLPDILATNYYSSELSLLVNNGDWTFRPAVSLTVGHTPRGVALADVNYDYALDILAANLFSDNVSVRLGRGDATFAPAANFPGGDGPGAIAVADFNRDTAPDFAVTNYFGEDLTVYLGLGDGSFLLWTHFPTHIRCTDVIAADLNGDQYPDLAVVDGTARHAYVLLNTGNWSAGAPAPGFGGGTPQLDGAAFDALVAVGLPVRSATVGEAAALPALAPSGEATQREVGRTVMHEGEENDTSAVCREQTGTAPVLFCLLLEV